MNIWGISGLKNSGKTEVSKMLEYLLNTPAFLHNWFCFKYIRPICKKWKLVAFADNMKQMLADLLNIKREKFDERNFKDNIYVDIATLKIIENPNILSDRQFNKLLKDAPESILDKHLSIRQLMQYFGTECCQKFFGKEVWVNTIFNQTGNLIISDVRFITEASAIKERKGKLIYVERPGTVVGNHASEQEVIELLRTNQFNIILSNTGSLKELFYQLKKKINE